MSKSKHQIEDELLKLHSNEEKLGKLYPEIVQLCPSISIRRLWYHINRSYSLKGNYYCPNSHEESYCFVCGILFCAKQDTMHFAPSGCPSCGHPDDYPDDGHPDLPKHQSAKKHDHSKGAFNPLLLSIAHSRLYREKHQKQRNRVLLPGMSDMMISGKYINLSGDDLFTQT